MDLFGSMDLFGLGLTLGLFPGDFGGGLGARCGGGLTGDCLSI